KKTLESLIYSGALDSFGDRASLLQSIQKMTAYLKEIEEKKETSQMGLFDMMNPTGSTASEVHGFTLEESIPMSFEERMKGEKEMIGYPVSGHPLDGLSEFIQKKSKNTGPIYEWLKSKEEKLHLLEVTSVPCVKPDLLDGEDFVITSETKLEDVMSDSDAPPVLLPEEEIIDIPQKKEDESVYATLIGLVHDVRKIQTKTGGMMIIASLESAGFDFRLTIFSRDYETYVSKIEEDRILVIDGKVKFDLERDEISISPGLGFAKKGGSGDAIKTFSITQFRDIALASGLVAPDLLGNPKQNGTSYQGSIANEKGNAVYYIDVPTYWSKNDLLDLRDFLEKTPVGLVPVWIRIGGKEKDTKFTIEDIESLKNWVEKKGV
ncbi:hypothetical protein KBD33_04855, partial [Candidatus Gracilibacteria bacterium]|nr:hypothetical protein [Candidatus Gracilibacteria bacterium]